MGNNTNSVFYGYKYVINCISYSLENTGNAYKRTRLRRPCTTWRHMTFVLTAQPEQKCRREKRFFRRTVWRSLTVGKRTDGNRTWFDFNERRGYKPDKRCFLIRRENRYGQLSNCNRISVFRFQFPDIPRKISAYLRAGFSSDANTRIMRCFYIVLNINDLYLMAILSFCKKHHIALRNRPFRRLKSTISHHKMGYFAS